MRKTIEIEDNLQEIIDGATEDVKNELLSYLDQNPDIDRCPNLNNDLDYSGSIHQIVDSAVPIYTNEIRDLWYLHGDGFEKAYDDAGVGEKKDDGWPSGWKAAAIYYYINQEVYEWYQNEAEGVFEDYQKDLQKKKIDKIIQNHAKEDLILA